MNMESPILNNPYFEPQHKDKRALIPTKEEAGMEQNTPQYRGAKKPNIPKILSSDAGRTLNYFGSVNMVKATPTTNSPLTFVRFTASSIFHLNYSWKNSIKKSHLLRQIYRAINMNLLKPYIDKKVGVYLIKEHL